MYNGIGLTTARGSGTNGFVTRNFALVRNHKDHVSYKTEDEIKQMDAMMNRKGNIEILNHEKKRKVELKCIEMKEIMQEQGYTEEEIEQKVNAFRKLLVAKEGVPENDDSTKKSHVMETHQLAEAKEKQNAKLREAFGIGDNYVDGSSFDPDRKAKEAAAAKERQTNYQILEEPDDVEDEQQSTTKRKKKKSHSHSRKRRKRSKRGRSESESPVRKDRKKSHKRKKDRIESNTHKSKKHKSHRSRKHRSHRRRQHHRDEDADSDSAADSANDADHASDHQKSQSSKRSRKKDNHDYEKSDEKRRKHKSRSPASDYSSESSRSHSRSPTPRNKHRSHGHSESPIRRSKSRSYSRSRSNSPTYRRSRSYSQEKDNRKRSRSNSQENGKHWSPIRKRRDSPSFLDARRITSARKRPIPYTRTGTSPSASESSYYSYTSRSCSRTPSHTRFSRSWSRESNSHRH